MNSRVTITTLLEQITTHPPFQSQARLTLTEIITYLQERGFGMIIILLSLPSAIPGCPPPIPSIFAFPLCIIAAQMMRGFPAPQLPERISSKTVSREKLNRTINKSLRYVGWLDIVLQPRLFTLTNARAERWLGLIMLLFGLMVMIPLPLTNTVPSIGIIFIATGILCRDGIAVILGTFIGVAWGAALLLLGQQIAGLFA